MASGIVRLQKIEFSILKQITGIKEEEKGNDDDEEGNNNNDCSIRKEVWLKKIY